MSDTSYKYNENLRGPGAVIEYTPEQEKIIARCMYDPIYFIENFVKIVTVDHGLQLFKLYPCQKDKIDFMEEHRKVIFMEGRQQGKTTTTTAYILWYTLFQPHKTVLIMANKKSAADEVMSRYRSMYECLPKWIQNGVITWNQGRVELDNRSKVYAYATTPSAGRGMTANLIYIDETAFIPTNMAEEFFASVSPVMSSGSTTKMILSSTPYGYNHFWRIWDGAHQGHNDFKTMHIPYKQIPGRDEEWAEEQRKQLGEVKFNQEILCKFLGSSYTLISGELLSEMKPKKPMYINDGLCIYRPVKPKHTYMMTVDTASGIGADSSAFIVTDITKTPYKIVAKYKNSMINPLLFPNIIEKIAREFNDAYVLMEINSNEMIPYILQSELEYENILFVGKDPRLGQRLGTGFGGGAPGSLQLGVNVDKKIKRIGCHGLKALIEERKYIVDDIDTIDELATFVETAGGTYAADDGSHDDMVMCLVLFAWASQQDYFKELTDINVRNEMYKRNMEAIKETILPIFHNNGPVDEHNNVFNLPFYNPNK